MGVKGEVKEETEVKEESKAKDSAPLSAEDVAKVKKQIEFYFSDSNYPKDKFLQETAKNDKEGWIPIKVLTTFNRLKVITTDIDQIQKAIAESDVVITNDQGMIKRKHPVPEKLDIDSRTVHVRGVDKQKTLDELEEFFSKHGKVNAIRCVKDKKTKQPSGTLFLEFGSKEEAEKFAEIKKLSWGERTIFVQTKEASLQFQKEKVLGKRNEPEPPTFEKGLICHFSGLPAENEHTPMTLKEFFKQQADAQYVEFIKGDVEGIVRLASKEEADKLAASTVPFNDITLTYKILADNEELMFWTRVEAQKKERRNGGGRKGGRGGGRGGRGKNRN